MKINKKQKISIYTGVALIAVMFLIWILSGSEIFTKTQVLVEIEDELFNTTYSEWQDKFIPGLDLTLIVSAVISVITLILVYIFKNKKEIQ